MRIVRLCEASTTHEFSPIHLRHLNEAAEFARVPATQLKHGKADLLQKWHPVDERNPKIVGTLGRKEMGNINPLARSE